MNKEIVRFCESLLSEVKPHSKIVIAPHIRVDGDAIGSSLALSAILQGLGYATAIYIDEKIPDLYHFMPGIERIHIYDEDSFSESFDMLFVLDCHERNRLGKRAALWDRAPLRFILDHHQYQTRPEAAVSLIQSWRSSTAELVFELSEVFSQIKGRPLLSEESAFNISVGIYADTGGLRFSNTKRETYLAMAQLKKYKVAIDKISEALFSQVSIGEYRARGLAFSKTNFECENKLSWCLFEISEIHACGTDEDELGAISSLMSNVKGVEMAIFMREEKNKNGKALLHLSIRSTDKIDSAAFAKQFGGGGHLRAAGASLPITENIHKTAALVVQAAKEEVAKLAG